MKRTITILVILIALSGTSLFQASCKKLHSNPPFKPDYFVFGYEGGFCLACTNIYMVKNDSVYFSMGYFSGDTSQFSTVSLGEAKYQKAKLLVDNFPSVFLNAPDSTYGFPPYPDQGNIVIACKNGGITRQWLINLDTTKLPLDIRSYMSLVKSTMDSMR